MKKVLSIMLVFIMLFGGTVFANAEDAEKFTEGFYTYTVEDGKATIVDADGDNLIGEVSTPTTLGGYPVVAIGYWGMAECENITSLIVSEGVEVLGDHALYSCDRIKEIKFPSTLRRIEQNALKDLGSLEELNLLDGLEYIGNDFITYNARIKRVDIPESVNTITPIAFFSIPSIKDVYIYNKDAKIGDYAFGYWEFGLNEGHTIGEAIEIMVALDEAYLEGDEAKKNELMSVRDEIMKNIAETEDELFIGYYMTIHGYTGSTAEAYAIANNIKFVSLDDEPVTDEPTTEEPTTEEPTTEEPTTDEPTTEEPTTNEPATDEPTTDAPTTAPEENETEGCTCMCHKTGFMGFIYKIVKFFWSLFKINPQCACGVAHY